MHCDTNCKISSPQPVRFANRVCLSLLMWYGDMDLGNEVCRAMGAHGCNMLVVVLNQRGLPARSPHDSALSEAYSMFFRHGFAMTMSVVSRVQNRAFAIASTVHRSFIAEPQNYGLH